MTREKPQFKHDCSKCQFLGRDSSGEYDLYACPQSFTTTFIARWSSDGPDYYSWDLDILTSNPEILEHRPMIREALYKYNNERN